MQTFTVEEAANALGITGQAVRDALRRGELARVDGGPVIRLAAASVDAFAGRRRTLALSRIGDPVRYAADIVRRLRPPAPATVTLIDGRVELVPDFRTPQGSWVEASNRPGGRRALTGIMPDAFAAFGTSTLEAAAVAVEGGACRWCVAHLFSRVRGDLAPTDTAANRVLMGSAPCPADQRRWSVLRDAQQRYRHAALAAMQQRAREQAQQRVTAAAAQLRVARSAAAAVAPQTARQRPRPITASADPPPDRPLDPRRDLTAAQARELAARRARRADVARRDGVQW